MDDVNCAVFLFMLRGVIFLRKAKEKERFFSRLLDIVLIALVFGMFFHFKFEVEYPTVFTILVVIIYFPIVHSIFSRSIGDFLMGLKIVDKNGHKITPSLAIMRFFAFVANIVYSRYSINDSETTFKTSNPTGFWQTHYENFSLTYEKDSETFLMKIKG